MGNILKQITGACKLDAVYIYRKVYLTKGNNVNDNKIA